MNESTFFNPYRVQLLLVRQLRFNMQTLLVGMGAIAGFLFFILAMRVIFSPGALSDGGFFGQILPFFFIGGYIFTSNIFSELRSPARGYMLLTLPASTLEKLAASWLISSVLYLIISIVVIFLVNLMLIILAALFTSASVPLFNLFSPFVLKMYAIYLVTQSVFLLGAIYFKKSNFLKTVLSLFVINIAIASFAALMARTFIFHDLGTFGFRGDNLSPDLEDFFVNSFVPVMKIIFWGCTAPFFWVVSYFCLKERQV